MSTSTRNSNQTSQQSGRLSESINRIAIRTLLLVPVFWAFAQSPAGEQLLAGVAVGAILAGLVVMLCSILGEHTRQTQRRTLEPRTS